MSGALCCLEPGLGGKIRSLSGDEAMVRRLKDLGLVEGTRVSCVLRAPSGDPAAYLIRGALIAIRNCDAAGIMVEGERCGG